MKKKIFALLIIVFLLSASGSISAQQLKVAVFDINLMVQAMPEYKIVDSIVRLYEQDSLSAEYQYYQWEYQRLDSTYKADSALVAQGKKQKSFLDLVAGDRQKMAINIVYWQQIAQNKSDNKRQQVAQPLLNAVANAYQKILNKKKYDLILKLNTYEMGFHVDNLFISVARELNLTTLPQNLLYAGSDPDEVKEPADKPPATKPPATTPKSKN